jgi:hypothetical protein
MNEYKKLMENWRAFEKQVLAEREEGEVDRTIDQFRGQTDDGANVSYAETNLIGTDKERIGDIDPESETYLDPKADTITGRIVDIDQQRTQSTIGGETYGTSFATTAETGGGRPEREQDSRSYTNAAGQSIQQTGIASDLNDLTGGGSTITVDGKVLRPGSKKYLKALNDISQAEDIEIEAGGQAGLHSGKYLPDTQNKTDLLADD